MDSINHPEDGHLLNRFQSGDHAAFARFYERLHPRLYFFALRFVSEKDAEDATAESFIALWKRRETFATTESVSAFLHVTLRNRCYNILRDQKVRTAKEEDLIRLLATEPTRDEHLLEQVRVDLVNLIYAQIDRLSPRMRDIFLLSYREGLRPAEIAQRLGISVQTVSNQKGAAIRLLKQALKDDSLLGALLLLITMR